jgi:hypothetical protein
MGSGMVVEGRVGAGVLVGEVVDDMVGLEDRPAMLSVVWLWRRCGCECVCVCVEMAGWCL